MDKCSYCGNNSGKEDLRGNCIGCGAPLSKASPHTFVNNGVDFQSQISGSSYREPYISFISRLVAYEIISTLEGARLLQSGVEVDSITKGGRTYER